MTQVLQYVAWAVGLWLNVLVIAALLRGAYRQYQLVLAYAIALMLSTVVEIAAGTAPRHSMPRELRDTYYWVSEVILQVLVFFVVIAFIHKASINAKRRAFERRYLIAGAAVMMIASFMLHRGLRPNLWMTLISRDLNICAVVLDLILWSILVTSLRPDRSLLLLSGGLGVELTGALMGNSIRRLSRSAVLPGTLVEVCSGFVGLYIWWRALRTVSTAQNT